MSIKTGAIAGAIVGAGVAVVLIALDHIGPLSPDANAFVDRLTFKLCPLYVLGFTNVVSHEWMVVVLTIIGNTLLYGIAFGIVAAIVSLFKRLGAWPRS